MRITEELYKGFLRSKRLSKVISRGVGVRTFSVDPKAITPIAPIVPFSAKGNWEMHRPNNTSCYF